MINKRKAIIVGLSSLKLKKNEKNFLKKYKPWGVILFTRNISSIDQSKKLVYDIKKCFKDSNYPILIDEEGGSVSRLKKIIDTKIFSSRYFSNLYKKDKDKFILYYKIYIDSVSSILNEIGININTVPVLDVIRKKTNKVIGDRSFASDPRLVSLLGNKCIALYKTNKVACVIKHIPGHGLATLDSHNKTPVVNEKKKILNNLDFYPFNNKKVFFAMTSHIIYSAIDSVYTTTHSKIIIKNIIRKKLNFKNILISDDISMKSLNFTFKENIERAFNAGCNIVLHCNGNIDEMNKLAVISPKIDKLTIKKTSEFYKFLM